MIEVMLTWDNDLGSPCDTFSPCFSTVRSRDIGIVLETIANIEGDVPLGSECVYGRVTEKMQ